MTFYASEQFDSDEEDILRRYFTNLDQPVFALVNLPDTHALLKVYDVCFLMNSSVN